MPSLRTARPSGIEGLFAKVVCTPGHTQGSVCFYFAALNLLVAGDTLFAGSIGRTDLPGGNYDQIIASITTRSAPTSRPDARLHRSRPRHHHRRGEAR